MSYWFLGTCFLIGISASCTVGPIFILTLNNSASQGFLRGFATALGSALGDGFLLFMGLMGALHIFHESAKYQGAIDLVGGIALCTVGWLTLVQSNKIPKANNSTYNSSEPFLLSLFKAFFSTVLNPLTLFFFMFIARKLLHTYDNCLSFFMLAAGSIMTTTGTLSILSGVAALASTFHKTIHPSTIRKLSLGTSIILLGFGCYFMLQAIRLLMFSLYSL